MRAAFAAVSLVSLAALAPPAVQAGPEETALCLVNALLVSNPAERIAACLVGANDDDPLCLEVFDRAANLLKTYPCAAPCLPVPPWVVVVVAHGSPGDQVTGVLSCDGAPAVDATATVSAFGVGIGFDNGSLPNGTTMACKAQGTIPATVDRYVVFCAPDP